MNVQVAHAESFAKLIGIIRDDGLHRRRRDSTRRGRSRAGCAARDVPDGEAQWSDPPGGIESLTPSADDRAAPFIFTSPVPGSRDASASQSDGDSRGFGGYAGHSDRKRKRAAEPKIARGIGRAPSHFDADRTAVWRETVAWFPRGVLKATNRFALEPVVCLIEAPKRSRLNEALGVR